jgi:DNA polymerase-1
MLENAPKKLVLIDGNSLLYRGFFSMRSLTTSAGQPTNAVFSFTMMLLTLLTDQKPDAIAMAWDRPEPTFRHIEYAAYKGTRDSTPSELISQGPLAREMTAAMNIPQLEAPGFEADDIIGTLARRGRDLGYEVVIVTGDLDALQLVEPGVTVMTTVKGVTDVVIYDEAAVEKRYGLKPAQLTDYRALKGDTSDNIPGVPGVGEKTASQLLLQYGTVENLIYHVDEIKQAKLQASLVAGTEQMIQSKRLATIKIDVPLETDLPALDVAQHRPHWDEVRTLMERLEFRQMLRRIPTDKAVAPAPVAVPSGKPAVPNLFTDAVNLNLEEYDPFADDRESTATPTQLELISVPGEYIDVNSPLITADLIADIKSSRDGGIGMRLHTDGEGILDETLLGVTIAVGEGKVYYIPIPLPEEVKALIENENVPKVTHEAKCDIGVLRRHGITLRGIVFDSELAAYLLNAGRRTGFALNEVAADYAGRELHPLDKKERKALDEDAIRGHERSEALAEADALIAIRKVQEPRLSSEEGMPVMRDLDLPIAPVLAEMELNGVRADVTVLRRLSEEMQAKISELETQIFGIAGMEFSIGSPKQLGEALFDRLKLPSGKKTKTGSYSTGADILEELAPNYPIASLIISHREQAKLKSTYADAMPLLVRADTGRIHTSLNQTVAATGRLSSSNPNLQNIPIRTEIGREIRRAFVAEPGNVLVSADYSQIELRLFAHVSRDPELVEAFASGEDIHKYTAGRIYGLPVSEVTSDMRRNAKTVNYAVIYGISEFALARLLSITFSEAKELKTSYFARFPGVRKYLDETIEFGKENGYVKTLFGRRRYIPDINSRVFQFRQASERAAANHPIQGSSADIMKLATIAVFKALQEENLNAKLLLQVHDELLFETTPSEIPRLAATVRKHMENIDFLTVPLVADVKSGYSWADVTPIE